MKRISKHFSLLPQHAVYDTLDTPVGMLLLTATPQGLRSILWEHEFQSAVCQAALACCEKCATHDLIIQTKQQLKEYFSGKRRAFSIPLDLAGTSFQLQVWEVLQGIPYGETLSYGEQAALLGDKNKARAVGLANGLNPVPIIMPCHRVIGSNGQLTGFGGGLESKAFLLQLEKSNMKLIC